MKKRGLSPVIATILLIAMVIVIGLIIFLWFRSLTEETITKFGDTNIKLVCNDVYFESQYNNGDLYISNTGNVPIFGMKIVIYGDGSHETKDLKDMANWPEAGLNQGGTFSGNILGYTSGAEKIVLVPVLIGSSDTGERTFMCDEGQHGVEQLV